MTDPTPIDTTYDVRTDAKGRDPDSHSATLRSYHRLLWSKPLPNGAMFDLDAKLCHRSELGEFALSSDSVVHTYTRWTRPARLCQVIRQIPSSETDAFYDLACTVGGYLVFPVRAQLEGAWRQSINQLRGIHPRIRDRFDLTLECIRRLYSDQESPLSKGLRPYENFFSQFESFPGYVGHFLLEDLVTPDCSSVRFYTQFDDFSGDPLPASSVDEYREYMRRSMDFVRARNDRIRQFCSNP